MSRNQPCKLSSSKVLAKQHRLLIFSLTSASLVSTTKQKTLTLGIKTAILSLKSMFQLSKVTLRTRQLLVCRLLHLINRKQQIVLPIKSLVRLSLLIALVIQSQMQSQFIMLMILKMLRKLLRHQHHKLLATKLKVNWYCQLTSAWTKPWFTSQSWMISRKIRNKRLPSKVQATKIQLSTFKIASASTVNLTKWNKQALGIKTASLMMS